MPVLFACKRINRRNTVAVVFLVVFSFNGTTRDREQSVWPKRLTYAAGIVPRGLNPLLDKAGWNEVSSVILGRLVRPDHKGRLEGDLAKSWSVSADGKTYTFELDEKAVWHDGQPFTADDVIFTWDALFDPKTQTTLDLNQAALARWTKTGPHRVVFELKQPDTGFLAAVTEIGILPAHRLRGKNINGEDFEREPIGTGPFRFMRREGSAFVLARHDTYHKGKPFFEEMVIRIIADDDARARAIAEGSADIGQVKPPHVAMLDQHAKRILRMRSGAWRGMPLNLRRPALQDKRVRQAIDLAIDRETIVNEALQGYGQVGYSPIPPASWAFTAQMNAKRYDPARATQLLKAAGWHFPNAPPPPGEKRVRMKDGKPFRLDWIVWKDEFFRRRGAEIAKSQLEEMGFHVQLHLVDGPTYNRLAENMGTEYDCYFGGWGGLLDPGDNLYKKYHSKGSQNRGGYANAQVDAWIEEARRMTDRAKAVALYEKVVAQITEDAVFLPIAYPEYIFATRADFSGVAEFTLDSWYEITKYAAEWGKAKQN
jgi:peptide/nickel transport system substrate-binding protein